MKGVLRGMFFAASTLAFLGCQGCQQVPVLQQHIPVNRYEGGAANKPLPLIDATTSLAFAKGQTDANPLAVTPYASAAGLNIDFATAGELSSLRFSNAPAVREYETRRNTSALINPVRDTRDFGAALSFSAADDSTGLGFDVAAVPRISVSKDGEFKQRRVGGEIRIGQNFDQRGEDIEASSWYLFAGADGEALVYEPDSERNFTDRMALRDQVTVGDMQAGVSFTRGPGQLSLSYIRREVEYKERGIRGEETEDFAGVSFTIRR